MNPCFNTFLETERLLLTAFELSDNSVKSIALSTGINSSTLYKWKTTDVHLSPQKADALLLYFYRKEPQTLIAAEILNHVLEYIYLYLASSTDLEVA